MEKCIKNSNNRRIVAPIIESNRQSLESKNRSSHNRNRIESLGTLVGAPLPSRPLLQARLRYSGQDHTFSVFIDSGADANLLDMLLASQLEIGRKLLERLIHATALDGHLLCRVTHRSAPLQMSMSGNHTETLAFHLIYSPQQPIILGYPWLRRHNPHIDWSTGTILQWSSHCHAVCLKAALSTAPSLSTLSEFPDLSSVPENIWI